MKWITAMYRNKVTTSITIILFSIISYQCLRFNMFDILTVILLALVMIMYLLHLHIWKMGREILEGSKKVKKHE